MNASPDLQRAAAPATTLRTTCCYCGVGCGIAIDRDARGRLSLRGDETHQGSRGALCAKGASLLHSALDTTDRLRFPELRRGRSAPLRRASWDEAIATVADGFRRIIAEHGPDAVAMYVSGQCLTEEYALANKLMKGCIGTNNIDTNSRLCMSSAVAGYRKALGSDSVPICYEDIDLADTFLICGSNAAWCHPVLFRRIEARKAADPGHVRLITIDPRRTDTAIASDLHLALRPGSDVALFHGLGHLLLRNGDVDRAFLADHVSGFADLEPLLRTWTPERTAAACDLAIADLETAARWLGADRRFLSLWTMGLNQSAMGTDKNLALINLSLLTGKIGRPGCGPFSLTGQPNAMGGREAGGLANLLPGHRDLGDATARAAVEDCWGVPRGRIQAKPGLTAVELFDALHAGRVKAVWVVCTNPLTSLPDARHAEAALRQAELVVVQDIARTATASFADVLLPAATWLEKTGTMTSSERRVTLVEPALTPPGEALPDAEIIARVGRALGFAREFAHDSLEAVYREHAATTRGTDCDISGITYDLLRRTRSVQWPFPDEHRGGTPRLFTDFRFSTPDGRARLHAPQPDLRSEALSPQFPLILTTYRNRDQWHTMTRSGKVARLRQHAPEPRLDVPPSVAAARGLADGDLAEVTSARGAVRVLTRISSDLRADTVALPMHWGRAMPGADGDLARANNLTSPLLDPVSKEPDLKWAAVQIAAYRPPRRRIVVIGAGAAALAFAEAHAGFDPQRRDPVVVLGEEPRPIYDRVQLPHLVAGSTGFSNLVRGDAVQLATWGARLRSGVRATAIDRRARRVVLADGSDLPYDVLILATGSRPNRPLDGPLAHPGAFALRRVEDAEAIAAAAQPGAHLVIQGAGLLGIELADALAARGCRVTILQRSQRLMGKQLDSVCSEQLRLVLAERGIAVLCGAFPAALRGPAQAVHEVVLDGGERIACAGFVFAVGTTPNLELARAAGLSCGRGISVDGHLRSSDPAIFAIGECAEVMPSAGAAAISVGTTAGSTAEAQALAEYLRGNPHRPFTGWIEANLLKIRDLGLATCGVIDPEPGDSVVRLHDQDAGPQGTFLTAIVRRDRLVGVSMFGDTSGFPAHVDLIRSGLELGDLRPRLLRLHGAGAAPRGALVCSCNQVGAEDIAEAIAAGATTVAAVGARCRAGTACGSCRPEVARLCAAAARVRSG